MVHVPSISHMSVALPRSQAMAGVCAKARQIVCLSGLSGRLRSHRPALAAVARQSLQSHSPVAVPHAVQQRLEGCVKDLTQTCSQLVRRQRVDSGTVDAHHDDRVVSQTPSSRSPRGVQEGQMKTERIETMRAEMRAVARRGAGWSAGARQDERNEMIEFFAANCRLRVKRTAGCKLWSR